MAGKVRQARLIDLLSLVGSRRRQRVLRLNPPYTLVQPDASLSELIRSQLTLSQRVNFIYVYVERGVVLGYVQARCRWKKQDEWTITTLAAVERAPIQVWEALLDEVCRAAGEAGVVRLYVKIPNDEARISLFRGVGFTHYTSEDIWGNLLFEPASSAEPPRKPLRSQRSGDAWNLMQLYATVTPPVVQRAESVTSRQWQTDRLPRLHFLSRDLTEKSYVWPDESDGTRLGGFIRLLTGERGHWIALLFRSDQSNRAVCPVALDYVLWKAARSGNKPLYCGVREYQAEVASLLEDRGFHLLHRQALLVKYLAVPVRERQPALVPFLVPKRSEMVATK